jgi:hypothetical protein
MAMLGGGFNYMFFLSFYIALYILGAGLIKPGLTNWENHMKEYTKKHGQPAIPVLDTEQKIQILLAAYTKHTAELLALEESQQTLVVILLGIFSVGIGALDSLPTEPLARGGIILAALLFVVFGALYTYRRTLARRAIRGLIVDIEIALQFYQPDVYLVQQSLYPRQYLGYPEKKWLAWIFAPVVFAAAVFIGLILL